MIYCSTASQAFSDRELTDLLEEARCHNINIDVTGMLLYENGSFFQIIEGTPDAIETLFRQIKTDARHGKVITIIQEPIVKRAFADWTMGFSRVSAQEVAEMVGLNDFFTEGNSLNQLDSNRAKKLLNAFKGGRWRAKIQTRSTNSIKLGNDQSNAIKPKRASNDISFAFQAIVDSRSRETIAYEVLPSDLGGNLLSENSFSNFESRTRTFDSDYWVSAILLARNLGINCDLSFALRAQQISNAHTAINSMLEAANKMGFSTSGIILKVNQDKLIGEPDLFARMIQEFRGAGLKLAIDNFGSGRASLNLLESYQPDFVSLNDLLVTGIDSNGARQAIVRGVNQTCQDLGIDIVADHVTRFAEFEWFNQEGITLFQGDLISKPEFEKVPFAVIPMMKEG